MSALKILVIRFSSIGDIVLCTPVIRALKLQLGAEVHLLSKASYAVFLENNPYIDQLHLLDKSPAQKARELKQLGFDYVIDLHNNLRTRIIKAVLQTSEFSFNKLNIEKMQAVSLKQEVLPKVHIVDRYLETLESFGLKNDGLGLDYFIPNEARQSLEKFNLPESFFAWALGGQHKTKQLPITKIKQVIESSAQQFVLLGGPEDLEEGAQLEAHCKERVLNLCGKLNLNQSAAVVERAKAVLSNDTGLMHIAAALKKPIISFWGNTIPELGMYPYYGAQQIPNYQLEVKGLSCRPCSKIGFNACPKKHFNCMMQQNMQEVVHLLKAL